MTNYHYPISYQGNIIWLVFFLLLFPPIGILLLFFNACVHKDGMRYYLRYRGSKFWLLFWTIVCFPVALILGLIRGFDIRGESIIL